MNSRRCLIIPQTPSWRTAFHHGSPYDSAAWAADSSHRVPWLSFPSGFVTDKSIFPVYCASPKPYDFATEAILPFRRRELEKVKHLCKKTTGYFSSSCILTFEKRNENHFACPCCLKIRPRVKFVGHPVMRDYWKGHEERNRRLCLQCDPPRRYEQKIEIGFNRCVCLYFDFCIGVLAIMMFLVWISVPSKRASKQRNAWCSVIEIWRICRQWNDEIVAL